MTNARPYALGEIYSFETRVDHKPDAPLSGRYAALKIIAVDDVYIYAAVLDGWFAAPPSLVEVVALGVLVQQRFIVSIGRPGVVRSPKDWENTLDDFRYLGMGAVSDAEKAMAAPGYATGSWIAASQIAEGEWRWRHDREAFEAEIARDRAAFNAKVEAERARIKSATFEKILAEPQFARWTAPPYPPPAFVEQAGVRIRETVAEIQAHGPKPRKTVVRAALKAAVEWFNAKDTEFGGVIATVEREDICDALAEIAYAAKQPELIKEFDDWRDW
jgi:hypothetical protein